MKILKPLLIVILFTTSILYGCSFKENISKNEEEAIDTAEEEHVKGIIASGIVKSENYESFFSGDNTVVTNIAVKEGQIIKKEDEILTLADGSVVKNNFNKAVVYRVSVVNNQNVSKGQELVVLGDMESYIVEGYILEEVIKDVKLGAKVTMIPKADNEKKYYGEVSQIYGKAERKENGDVFVKVMINIDNEDDFLKDGFNLDLEIER